MKPNAEKLAERAGWLREQLDNLPSINVASADWIQARTQHALALRELSKTLAAMPDLPFIGDSCGATTRVRMLGITTTSTMGLEGALRNWLARAEVRSCMQRP